MGLNKIFHKRGNVVEKKKIVTAPKSEFQIMYEKFERPLNSSDQTYYLKLYRETGDKEARRKLYEHNLRLVRYATLPYVSYCNSLGITEDYLFYLGCVALAKAIDETYNINDKTKFSTFVCNAVKYSILNAITEYKKSRDILDNADLLVTTHVVWEDPTVEGRMVERDIRDIIDSKVDISREYVERERYNTIMNSFDDEERYIAECLYGLNGRPQEDMMPICKRLGYTSKFVIYKKCDKVRKRFEYYYSDSDNELDTEYYRKEALEECIEGMKDQNKIDILKYTYGLDGYEQKDIHEIAKILNLEETYVFRVITQTLQKIGFEDERFKITKEEALMSIGASRNMTLVAIAEHYFGLRGKPQMTDVQEISQILKMSTAVIFSYLRMLIDKIGYIKLNGKLPDDEVSIDDVYGFYKFAKEQDKVFVEDLFGINNHDILSDDEIMEKYDFTKEDFKRKKAALMAKIRNRKEIIAQGGKEKTD